MNIQPKLISQINKIPSNIKTSDFPLTRLNLEPFEGIQDGIKLFDKLNLPQIAFITKKLETLNLFRGCSIGCTHCLKDAKPLPANQQTILFEDLQRFLDGFKLLSERFEFNVLNGNKYLNIIDDSNPNDIPILDSNGTQHSVVEAMKNIWRKLNIPILFVTSGWNQKNKYSQTVAEDLAKMVEKKPNSVEKVEISINPFSYIMEKSRENLKNNNKENAEFFRHVYTSRMANVLKTLLYLFKTGKADIIYRHADSGILAGNELVGESETRKLYEEIYAKLKQTTGSKIEYIPELKPENVTRFDRSHLIEPSGRGRRYFPFTQNLQEQSALIDETIEWNCLSQAEKMQQLLDFSVKCVDIDGKIYATMPSNRVKEVFTPIELTIPTDIRLNYQTSNQVPLVFSDIEL